MSGFYIAEDEDLSECRACRCGDRYLFVTACEDWLIVSLMLFDFFEEDDTPIPDFDDSELEFEDN